MTVNEAAPTPLANMGQPIPRIDALLKVTGKARYPADIPVSNLAYGYLATSDIARGIVKSIDLSKARTVPGVIDIVSYDEVFGNIKKPEFGMGTSSSIAPLNEKKIWYDGQIIALVVAETFEAAREGAMRITADYDIETPSAGLDSEGSETIEAVKASKTFKEDVKVGDFDKEFAASPVTIDQTYSTPTQHHNPIELFSTTAYWSGDDLIINEPSQNVTGWKNELANQLSIDPANVRIVSPFIGGAFGSKGSMTPRTAIVALAAKRLGRPVRCVVTRDQGFTTMTYRAETRHHIKMGATPDGKITSLYHEGWEVTSRPDPYVVGGTTATGRLYGYKSVLTKVSIVKADRNTPGFMRSPPEHPYVYALENAMDEMAVALKMDPVEFRRINDTQIEPIGGRAFSSRSLMQCYDQAAEAFQWKNRHPGIGSMTDGDWLIGMGCATAVYPTNIAPCAVRIRLTPDGHVRVQTAAHEIGNGARTIAAQLTGERLGVPVDHIEVEMGDTTLPPAPVAGGSNTTASMCSTIIKSCDAISARIFQAASAGKDGPLAGKAVSEMRLEGGKLIADGASEPLTDAIKRIGSGAIEEYTEFAPEGTTPEAVANLYKGKLEMIGGEKGPKVKYAFGAEFVEVRIHRRTREIRVPRIVGAFAGGRIMNTRTARSQLMGGMIWGISTALHEGTDIDRATARYVNRDFQDYLVPVNADINDLQVILVSEVDHDVNPAGVKGLGELGNVGTAAAVASAVFHATGKRVRDLPIRVDDLFA